MEDLVLPPLVLVDFEPASRAITITRTFEQEETRGEDVMQTTGISCKISSANGDLNLLRRNCVLDPSIAVANLYTLVRLSELGRWKATEILAKLEEERVKDVASIIRLDDGSIEMVVLVKYLSTLRDKLGKKFPGSKVDPSYAPYDETEIFSFLKRALRIIGNAWPTAAAYYVYLQSLALRNITHWECHKCSAGKRILGRSKVCKNRVCRHRRCKRCFFLGKDNERVLYCGGSKYKVKTDGDLEYVPQREDVSGMVSSVDTDFFVGYRETA